MKKFEYTRFQLHVSLIFTDTECKQLDKYGKQGWELTAIVTDKDHATYYFKRENK